jgi:hypothetical protein
MKRKYVEKYGPYWGFEAVNPAKDSCIDFRQRQLQKWGIFRKQQYLGKVTNFACSC